MAYNFTIDTPNPMQGINNALQTYGNVRQIQLAEEQAGMQRQEWQQKQEALKAQQAQVLKYQAELEDVAEKPTPANIRRLYLSNPEAHQAWSSLMDREDSASKARMTQHASDLFMLINSGNVEGARKKIDGVVKAAENSGNKEQVQSWTMYGEMLDIDPNSLALASGQILSATKDGRDILESLAAKEKTTAETRKLTQERKRLVQETKRAATLAKFEEIGQVQELINDGASPEILMTIPGVPKELKRIAALDAKKRKATTAKEAEKNQLAIDESKIKIEQMQRQNKSDALKAYSNIDVMQSTIKEALKYFQEGDDSTEDMFGRTAAQRATGPLESGWITISDDVAAFETIIEQIKNQAFIANIAQVSGLGSLSDAEGRTLKGIWGDLELGEDDTEVKRKLEAMLNILDQGANLTYETYGIERPAPFDPRPTDPVSQAFQRDFNQRFNSYMSEY